MKLFIAAICLFTSLSSHAFNANAQCNITNTGASCYVKNNLPRAMICSGKAVGITMRGVSVYSYINNKVFVSGEWGNIYINSSYNDPLVRAGSNINCHTI